LFAVALESEKIGWLKWIAERDASASLTRPVSWAETGQVVEGIDGSEIQASQYIDTSFDIRLAESRIMAHVKYILAMDSMD